jgi:hypothetical protein
MDKDTGYSKCLNRFLAFVQNSKLLNARLVFYINKSEGQVVG